MKEDRNPQLLVCFTESVSMQASFEDERFISINSTQSFYLYWTGVFLITPFFCGSAATLYAVQEVKC